MMIAMFHLPYFIVALVACGSDEQSFPLRTDPPPKEWRADEINKGLPYRWEKGTINILAWEVTEDDHGGGSTQIMVLKRYDEPTQIGKYRWVLALLYHDPTKKDWPWDRQMLLLRPVLPGEQMPKTTSAQIFGYELYKELPTDKQLDVFLREAGWTPTLGPRTATTVERGKVVEIVYTTRLVAGGVDRARWKGLFGRDVPTNLFSELRKASAKEIQEVLPGSFCRLLRFPSA